MNALFFAGASTAALAVTGAVGSSFFVNYLAEEDVMFTKVPEGTAKAVMRGESFRRFVTSLKAGRYPNDPFSPWYDDQIPDWEILDGHPRVDMDNRTQLLKQTGTYFVGIPPFQTIKKYGFQWSEMWTNPATNKDEVWVRDEETDVIFLTDFPYVMTLQGAKTKEGITIDLEYILVLRVTNPEKALFGTENWLTIVKAAANRKAKSYVGSKGLQELYSECDVQATRVPGGSATNPDDFSCPIVELTDDLPDDKPGPGRYDPKYEKGLFGQRGVTIISANPQKVTLSGDHAGKLEEAATTAYVAEQKAFATVTQADADAHATRVTGQAAADVELYEGQAKAKVAELMGKANARATIYRIYSLKKAGALAPTILQTDAMSSPGPNRTVVLSLANNPALNNIPGLVTDLEKLGITSMPEFEELVRQIMTTPPVEGKAA